MPEKSGPESTLDRLVRKYREQRLRKSMMRISGRAVDSMLPNRKMLCCIAVEAGMKTRDRVRFYTAVQTIVQ
jgi:hypothetical protein